MIYFTSDLHFKHKNIMKHCNRPFASVEEMDKTLIENWNNFISNNDEIYILGDFGWFNNIKQANEYLDRLNGIKYFIRGNHDKFLWKNEDELHVEWIRDYYTLQYKGETFVLFHYPIYEWFGYFRNSIMLHGHIHTDNKDKKQLYTKGLGRIYDVGVDANDFCPVSADAIIEVLKNITNV